VSLLPKTVTNLIDEFAKLPGVGPKTAARLAFYLLTKSIDDNRKLGEAVLALRENLTECGQCYNYAESDPCPICADDGRNHRMLAVVEEPLDLVAMEKSGFDGVYHVLGGVVSPVNGVGPDDIRIGQLIDRVKNNVKDYDEIILATDPSLEGEATAMYIKQYLAPYDIRLTRLARGLPVGGDLEYTDEATLTRAFEGRKEY
jgi:recombination protein RecR